MRTGAGRRLSPPGGIVLWTLLACLCPLSALALTWSQNPPQPIPVPKGYHAAGVVGNEIYVAGGGCLGGFSCIDSTSTAYVYDPVGDGWTELFPMSVARTYPAGAVAPYENPPGSGNYEDRFYVIGGTDIRDWPLQLGHTTIEEYDPLTGQWRTRSAQVPLSIALSSRAVTVDGLIYLIGGHDAESFVMTDEVYVYDPNADTMTAYSGDPLPQPRSEGAAVLVGRQIFYIGGWIGTYGEPTSTSLVLDLDTGLWSPIASSPRPAGATAAFELGGTIYLLGGWNGFDQIFPYVSAYDIAGDSWSEDSELTCIAADPGQTPGRAGLSVHKASDGTDLKVYAVGGNAGGSSELSCNESSPTVVPSDVTPPDFAGLTTAEEPECPDPPSVVLTWAPGQDLETPPVTYNVYRGRDPGFLPDPATNLVTPPGGVSGTSYTDTDVVCWDQDPRPYYYIVRAQDSAIPPNEDQNLNRVPIPVLCTTPPPPPDIGVRLFVSKTPIQIPVLDWSTYPAPAEVTFYGVYRTINDPRDVYASPYMQTPTPTLTDSSPNGELLFYKVRAGIDCLGIESDD